MGTTQPAKANARASTHTDEAKRLRQPKLTGVASERGRRDAGRVGAIRGAGAHTDYHWAYAGSSSATGCDSTALRPGVDLTAPVRRGAAAGAARSLCGGGWRLCACLSGRHSRHSRHDAAKRRRLARCRATWRAAWAGAGACRVLFWRPLALRLAREAGMGATLADLGAARRGGSTGGGGVAAPAIR